MTTNPFALPIAKALKQPLATTLTNLKEADADTFNDRAATLLVHMLKSQSSWSNKDRPRIADAAILLGIHRHHGPLSASWVSASWTERSIRITPTSIQIDDRALDLKTATPDQIKI